MEDCHRKRGLLHINEEKQVTDLGLTPCLRGMAAPSPLVILTPIPGMLNWWILYGFVVEYLLAV